MPCRERPERSRWERAPPFTPSPGPCRCGSRSPTQGRGWTRRRRPASSSPSSPPRRTEGGSGWRRSGGSSARTGEPWKFGPRQDSGPASAYGSRVTPPRPEPTPDDRERDPRLDGVRGIAILLVLLCHLTQYGGMAPNGPWLDRVWRTWTLPLGLGVDLFFVLSG